MKWYTSNTDTQGLIIDECTGRTVAVSYDKKDAPLIAAAPDLLEAAETLLMDAIDRNECFDEDTGNMFDDWKALDEAINKAKEV